MLTERFLWQDDDGEEPFINLADLPDPAETDAEQLAWAKAHVDLSPVINQYRTWAVTTYGMECLTRYYPIKRGQLYGRDPEYRLDRHMATKRWVDMSDFLACYHAARRFHFPRGNPHAPGGPRRMDKIELFPIRERAFKMGRNIPPGVRFDIFKRDRYCCRICGRGADDGVVLHIDHIVALANGGRNHTANLQTLCAACNWGKEAKDL